MMVQVVGVLLVQSAAELDKDLIDLDVESNWL